MNDKQKQFFNELAELMRKHEVSFSANEVSAGYEAWADGVEFQFGNGDTHVIGRRNFEYNGHDLLEIIEKQ